MGLSKLALGVVALVGCGGSPMVLEVAVPEQPEAPAEVRDGTVHIAPLPHVGSVRAVDASSRYFVAGGLRITVDGDRTEIAREELSGEILQAQRIPSGWVFQAGSAFYASDEFGGPLRLVARFPGDLASMTAGEALYYVGSGQVWRMDGRSSLQLLPGLENHTVTRVFVSGGALYALDASGQIWVTSNEGQSWDTTPQLPQLPREQQPVVSGEQLVRIWTAINRAYPPQTLAPSDQTYHLGGEFFAVIAPDGTTLVLHPDGEASILEMPPQCERTFRVDMVVQCNDGYFYGLGMDHRWRRLPERDLEVIDVDRTGRIVLLTDQADETLLFDRETFEIRPIDLRGRRVAFEPTHLYSDLGRGRLERHQLGDDTTTIIQVPDVDVISGSSDGRGGVILFGYQGEEMTRTNSHRVLPSGELSELNVPAAADAVAFTDPLFAVAQGPSASWFTLDGGDHWESITLNIEDRYDVLRNERFVWFADPRGAEQMVYVGEPMAGRQVHRVPTRDPLPEVQFPLCHTRDHTADVTSAFQQTWSRVQLSTNQEGTELSWNREGSRQQRTLTLSNMDTGIYAGVRQEFDSLFRGNVVFGRMSPQFSRGDLVFIRGDQVELGYRAPRHLVELPDRRLAGIDAIARTVLVYPTGLGEPEQLENRGEVSMLVIADGEPAIGTLRPPVEGNNWTLRFRTLGGQRDRLEFDYAAATRTVCQNDDPGAVRLVVGAEELEYGDMATLEIGASGACLSSMTGWSEFNFRVVADQGRLAGTVRSSEGILSYTCDPSG